RECTILEGAPPRPEAARASHGARARGRRRRTRLLAGDRGRVADDARPALLLHKARNVIERLPKPLHASVRRVLRQAWELDDADQAGGVSPNRARRLDREAPGVAASILEGLDEMVTVTRLGLPVTLRRSLACTNSIEPAFTG